MWHALTYIRVADGYLWHTSESCVCHIYKWVVSLIHICDMHTSANIRGKGSCHTHEHEWRSHITQVAGATLPMGATNENVTQMKESFLCGCGVVSYNERVMSHKWSHCKETCHTNGPTVRSHCVDVELRHHMYSQMVPKKISHVTQMVPLYPSVPRMKMSPHVSTHNWSHCTRGADGYGASRVNNLIFVFIRDMIHSGSFIYVTWFLHTYDKTQTYTLPAKVM